MKILLMHYYPPNCGTRTYSREVFSMYLFLPNQNKPNRKKNRIWFLVFIFLSVE